MYGNQPLLLVNTPNQNKQMPMLKKYPTISRSEEVKFTPKESTINAILNYSKSIEVKKSKILHSENNSSRVLLNLN